MFIVIHQPYQPSLHFNAFYCNDDDGDDGDDGNDGNDGDDGDDGDDDNDDDDGGDDDAAAGGGACEMPHFSNEKRPRRPFCPTSTALAAALQSSATGVLDLHPS